MQTTDIACYRGRVSPKCCTSERSVSKCNTVQKAMAKKVKLRFESMESYLTVCVLADIMDLAWPVKCELERADVRHYDVHACLSTHRSFPDFGDNPLLGPNPNFVARMLSISETPLVSKLRMDFQGTAFVYLCEIIETYLLKIDSLMEMCTNCALRYGAFRLNDEWPDSDPGSDFDSV